MNATEPIIQASGLTKSYGPVAVLRGIDLEIRAGELTSILGASGAGKTTLLQILGTLDGPDSGTLRVAGQQLQMRHLRIGRWDLGVQLGRDAEGRH